MNTDINSDMNSDMNSEANSDMNSEANSDMNSDTQTQTEPETGTRSEAQPNRARIMVALDGSLRAETVLPHAVAIALATGSILHLVTIAQPPRDFEPGVQLGVKCTHNVWEFDLCGAKHYLASVSRRLYGLGVEVECEALQGDPAETLIEHAELDPEIEMVAMTAYGRNGPSGWPLGSVTEKVLLAGDKPLLVARAEGAICVPLVHTYRRILVPLDGSVLAEQALQLAHSLAVRTGAALLLLSAVLPPEQRGVLATGVRLPVSLKAWEAEVGTISAYLQRTARRLSTRTPGLSVETQVVLGRPAEAIKMACEQAHTDLIVLSTHGGSHTGSGDAQRTPGPARTYLGSVAMKVAQSAPATVLLVRAKAPEEPQLPAWANARGLQSTVANSSTQVRT